jgi:hypothetical protein
MQNFEDTFLKQRDLHTCCHLYHIIEDLEDVMRRVCEVNLRRRFVHFNPHVPFFNEYICDQRIKLDMNLDLVGIA